MKYRRRALTQFGEIYLPEHEKPDILLLLELRPQQMFMTNMNAGENMGANVEVDIFLKKGDLSLQQLFSLLENKGLSVNIKEMSIFDDWHYTNETIIDLPSLDLHRNDLVLKKFTLIHFVVNTKWRCVLITSFEDTCIDLSFALNTDDLLLPGETDYDDYIEPFYDQVADSINETIREKPWSELFIVASMGVEYSVEFHHDIQVMLHDNNSVDRWILPNEGRGQ